jgi:hypothetical protein
MIGGKCTLKTEYRMRTDTERQQWLLLAPDFGSREMKWDE